MDYMNPTLAHWHYGKSVNWSERFLGFSEDFCAVDKINATAKLLLMA